MEQMEESLMRALEDADFKEMSTMFSRHQSRADSFSFSSLLDSLSRRSHVHLLASLESFTATLIEQALRLQEQKEVKKDGERTEVDGLNELSLWVTNSLRASVTILRLVLTPALDHGTASGDIPQEILRTIQILHDAMLSLSSDAALLESISRLCETCWEADVEGKEGLVTQTLPYLLARSLELSRQADVHRVYKLREALELLDFEDESIEGVKGLLLRTAFTPCYIKSSFGQRFLVYLLGLNPQIVRELIIIIRNQVPSGRRSVLEAYGDVVFRAWKQHEGACVLEVEYGFVQGFIEAAVVARSPALAASIRQVLSAFTKEKSQKDVSELLLRVSEPIIFRSLQAANPAVRKNAVLFLGDLFPLCDPSAKREEASELMDRQISVFKKLLLDPVPAVRGAAVEATCKLLGLHWEVLPPHASAGFLQIMVQDLSGDASSPAVRLAVVAGVTELLNNPLSHEAARLVIPKLACAMKDKSKGVRQQAMQLLAAAKEAAGMKMKEMTNLDALLHVLSLEDAATARHITKLLLPTFFPSNQPVADASERCLSLIKRSPKAAKSFCRWMVAEGAEVERVAFLAQHLVSILVGAGQNRVSEVGKAQEEARSRRTGSRAPKKQKKPAAASMATKSSCVTVATDLENITQEVNRDSSYEKEGVPDGTVKTREFSPEFLEACFETVVSLGAALGEQDVGLEEMDEVFGKDTIQTLLASAKTSRARCLVLKLAAAVPPTDIPDLAAHCSQRVSRMIPPAANSGEEFEEVRAVLKFVAAWGGLPQLVPALEASLEMASADEIDASAVHGETSVGDKGYQVSAGEGLSTQTSVTVATRRQLRSQSKKESPPKDGKPQAKDGGGRQQKGKQRNEETDMEEDATIHPLCAARLVEIVLDEEEMRGEFLRLLSPPEAMLNALRQILSRQLQLLSESKNVSLVGSKERGNKSMKDEEAIWELAGTTVLAWAKLRVAVLEIEAKRFPSDEKCEQEDITLEAAAKDIWSCMTEFTRDILVQGNEEKDQGDENAFWRTRKSNAIFLARATTLLELAVTLQPNTTSIDFSTLMTVTRKLIEAGTSFLELTSNEEGINEVLHMCYLIVTSQTMKVLATMKRSNEEKETMQKIVKMIAEGIHQLDEGASDKTKKSLDVFHKVWGRKLSELLCIA